MKRITITYVHPILGPVQVKDAQSVTVADVEGGIVVIQYVSASGSEVGLTTNAPFVVREEQEADAND